MSVDNLPEHRPTPAEIGQVVRVYMDPTYTPSNSAERAIRIESRMRVRKTEERLREELPPATNPEIRDQQMTW